MTSEGWRRLGQTLREGDITGAAILASRGLLVVRVDRMLVLKSPELGPRPTVQTTPAPESGLSVREALAGDLPEIIRLFPHNAGRYAERMRRREECLLVLHGTTVIGMTWLGFDPNTPRELGCAIQLPDASCWNYDALVLTEHRRLGAFVFLMREMFQRLPARGIRRVFAAVSHLNKASLAAHGRLGYTTSGVIDRYAVMGIPFLRLTDGEGRVHWIRGGSDRAPTLNLGGVRSS